MFSFKTLAIASAVALGAASTAFAAPTEAVNVLARCGCSSIATILDDVSVVLTPVVQEFHYITADNCTVDALTPIVTDVKNIISGAIVEVNNLVGQPAEIILATVDGTAQVTVTELAQLVGSLITLVFTALGAVLNVAGGSVIGVVVPLLATVGEVVGSLVIAILSIVGSLLGGLLAAILAEIGAVINVILSLNITVFIHVFSISA